MGETMFKRHIIPAIAGIVSTVIVFPIAGYFIGILPLGDMVKGALILVVAIGIGIAVNNFLSKRAQARIVSK
ncbi:hypothetical protein B7H23_00195 [Notoacmeibacter marinus]|uniref:Uncharacterized protein n=1 Tax=Notoacmeibacter marinus TaxID=1876515 RepID=A0A231V018_9HYPH|nr:hypothetical protein [Notoacmeibacter marinus]OXT01447.1 hypothetical protein B7H23_00195 [Notoacmeibacter marinus]